MFAGFVARGSKRPERLLPFIFLHSIIVVLILVQKT